jgi:hypothetical protein
MEEIINQSELINTQPEHHDEEHYENSQPIGLYVELKSR